MQIRRTTASDLDFLLQMLLEAAFHPMAARPDSKDARNDPRLSQWIAGFGERKGDIGLIANNGNESIGAAWCRLFSPTKIIGNVGYCGPDIPCLAIAVDPKYRAQGIGTQLLETLYREVKANNFAALSLAVGETNPAMSLYKRLGYREVNRTGTTLTMLKSS